MPKGRNTRYHSARRVDRDRFTNDLEEGAPEDIADYFYWQRANKNVNLGYPEDYEGSRGY